MQKEIYIFILAIEKKLCEWNSLLTKRIWRERGLFVSLYTASQVLAVSVRIGGTKEWSERLETFSLWESGSRLENKLSLNKATRMARELFKVECFS